MEQHPSLVVTGASGLVGSALGLRRSVVPLSRRQRGPDTPWWDPDAGEVYGLDDHTIGAVVHLAGENVGDGRWTEDKKARIRESRVRGTRTIASFLSTRQQRPEVLVSASGVGVYGDRGEETLTEASAKAPGRSSPCASGAGGTARRRASSHAAAATT